jgi:hypothetical protein
MESNEPINHDELIQQGLMANKTIFVVRVNGVIDKVNLFDSKDALAKHLRDYYEESDAIRYYSADEAFIAECNSAYYSYLSDIMDLSEVEPNKDKVKKLYAKLKTYDEFNKDRDRSIFVDGLYYIKDGTLLIEVSQTNTTKSSPDHMDIYVQTFEIY